MKILLIDDHALFREGVAMLLDSLEPNVEVLQSDSYERASGLIAQLGPLDIVLMDLQLPGTPGLEAIRILREQHPALPVVAVSSSDDRETVLAVLDAGAMGFIPKSSPSAILKSALRLVLAKGIYLPPAVFLTESARTPAPPDPARPPTGDPAVPVTPATLGLTTRQSEVLHRILQGKPAKVICKELSLSGSTVKVHTSAVLRALNVTTRTQAVVAAGKLGLRFA